MSHKIRLDFKVGDGCSLPVSFQQSMLVSVNQDHGRSLVITVTMTTKVP